jgi:dolichyl-phosphate-mannose--protein O-mannosyl transferase
VKYYVMTTGTAFGLLALAHLVRVILEGVHVTKSPIFIVTTIGSIALCIWAWRLLKQLRRAS